MNQSARESLALARELGGTPFVDFIVQITSHHMADRVLPDIQRLRFTEAQARICDRAFLIGLFEAWSRAPAGTVWQAPPEPVDPFAAFDPEQSS